MSVKKGKGNSIVFYIAVVIAVINVIAFVVEANWTAFLFFVLATFATFKIKPDKTFALITGIIVSNLYRATNGLHEGLTSSKSTQDLKDNEEDTNVKSVSIADDDFVDGIIVKNTPIKGATNGPTKAPKPTLSKPKVKNNDDLKLDNMLNSGAVEQMMDRQTQLMKNLKQMQPMIAQAKNMLNALPKGFVKQALQQFKLKQK